MRHHCCVDSYMYENINDFIITLYDVNINDFIIILYDQVTLTIWNFVGLQPQMGFSRCIL